MTRHTRKALVETYAALLRAGWDEPTAHDVRSEPQESPQPLESGTAQELPVAVGDAKPRGKLGSQDMINPSTSHPNVSESYSNESAKISLDEINDIPRLSAGDERNLVRRMAQGDSEARENLVKANLWIVVSILGRYLGLGLEPEQLFEAGNRGLRRSAEVYVEEVGIRFSAFASFYIKSAIRTRLMDSYGVMRPEPSYVRSLISQHSDQLNDIETDVIRLRYGLESPKPLTCREVSKNLGLSSHRVRQLETRALTKLMSTHHYDDASGRIET